MSKTPKEELARAQEALEIFDRTPVDQYSAELCEVLGDGLRHVMAEKERLKSDLEQTRQLLFRRMAAERGDHGAPVPDPTRDAARQYVDSNIDMEDPREDVREDVVMAFCAGADWQSGRRLGYILIPAAVEALLEKARQFGQDRVTFGVMQPDAGPAGLPRYVAVVSESVEMLEASIPCTKEQGC